MTVGLASQKLACLTRKSSKALNTVSFRMDPISGHRRQPAAGFFSTAAAAAALALPFAGLFGVPALFHRVKVFRPLLSSKVLPPAVDA